VSGSRTRLPLTGGRTAEAAILDGSYLHGTYDYRLVVLSIVLAVFAAYVTLDFAGRVAAVHRWARAFWLAGGAVSMGLGIWSMHYIGMLAFHLPVPVLYHYPTVIISLLAAVAASVIALYTMSREKMGIGSLVVGSLTIGGGIASMHYIGMAAMRLPATMDYHRGRVCLSVVLAIVISLVALVLAFNVRQEQKTSQRKLLSALVMGAAIPLMHYTGMWAVQFRASAAPLIAADVVRVSSLGIAAISAASFLVMILAIVSAFTDRTLSTQMTLAALVRDGESRFRVLAEAIPNIVWTATSAGVVDYCNHRLYEVTGLTVDEPLSVGWSKLVHDDDRAQVVQTWQQALNSGIAFETQYRLQTRNGYRWYLVRATPMRDSSGQIVEWFGTCTDIEDQKQNQQILEQQIKVRTEELAEANNRLQEEVMERDYARRELDEQNEKMMQDLTERSQRATLLAKMGELLQSCISKDEVFSAALGFAPKIFPTSRGAIALLNSGRNVAEIAGNWNDCLLSVSVFEPSACWALRTGHPHLVVAGDNTARCAHAAGVRHTYLCIPILAQGEALGTLHFQATDDAPTLADSELSFKTTFAGQVGLSVANIRLREALRSQSIKDPLTSLYNRRYLTEMLERETRRCVRSEQPLGILMLDLDHFKKFNDTYGHEAGDTILREAASFLSKSIRAEDIVCRFGGEEFVVILPTADLDAAYARAERIRSKLHELTVLHQGQSLGMITVSVGVASLPLHGTSPDVLLAAADAALYRAKREGRDRVVKSDPPADAETNSHWLKQGSSKSAVAPR
jgi:diguanylate cyclase (GGDEF)-like protein/PAS domain S-box-containing protein